MLQQLLSYPSQLNPYSPWERSSNENLNGLIRQYIPKKSNFDDSTDEEIK